jgi:AcrR family transcriptional regulator
VDDGECGASEPDRVERDAPPTVERIRDVALKCFAERGTSGTSLRSVAASAGVSLGLVQHHFATKAGLIKAVDDYVMHVVVPPLAQPISGSTDSLSQIGDRVNRMFVEHPDVAGYLGRALVDGSALGPMVFDALMELGMARWQQRAERGETRPDIDMTWAVINSLSLALGTFSLRTHIDRYLPETLTTPAQLERWEASVTSLLRDGLFRRPGD